MKTTVNFSDFAGAFRNIRPDNFTYDGLRALFDYLAEYEESTGEELKLDVIAFCGEFWEYKNIKDYNTDCDMEYESYDEIDDVTVIPVNDDAFIIEQS